MTTIECPFPNCQWTPATGEDDPPPVAQRSDHVDMEHEDVVRAVYTGEWTDAAIGAVTRAVAAEELNRRDPREA